jgi:hypothetical protein
MEYNFQLVTCRESHDSELEDSDEETYLATYDRVRSCSPDLKSNRSRSCNQSWIDRIKPTNEQEENEQLRLALSASYAENEGQHERGQYGIESTYYSRSTLPLSKPSSTCTSTASSSARTVQESVNINEVTCTVNDAAAALLSLRNLDSDTT